MKKILQHLQMTISGIISTLVNYNNSYMKKQFSIKHFLLMMLIALCGVFVTSNSALGQSAKTWYTPTDYEPQVTNYFGTTGTSATTTTTAGTFRTGTTAINMLPGSTSAKYYWNSNLGIFPAVTTGYVHIIYWAKGYAGSASAEASLPSDRYVASGTSGSGSSDQTGTSVTLSKTAWTQCVSNNIVNNATRVYFAAPQCQVTGSSTGSGCYFDDFVIYSDATATADVTAPTSGPSALGYSGGSLSWTNGSDAGTGVQGSIVLGTNGSSPTTPVIGTDILHQGYYPVNGTITVSGTTWTVLANDNTLSGNTTAKSASVTGYTTYAVLNFDKAYNYSAVTAYTPPVGGIAPPTFYAAGSATVDAAFNVTYTDNGWYAATGTPVIKIGGTTLTAGYSVSSSQITFTPSASVPAGLLQTAGTNKSITISKTGYTDASLSQTIGAGVASQLGLAAITTPQAAGTAFNVTVNSQDQYGNTTNVTSNTGVSLAFTGAGTLSGNTGTISSGSSSTTISTVSDTKAETVTFTASATSGMTLATSGSSNSVIINAGVATKLSINAITTPQTVATNFSVTVTAQDANGNTANVTSATGVSLAAAGLGTLSGNTATIAINTSSITLASVKYTKAETTTFTASTTSGMSLTTSGASNSVTFNPGVASKLSISTIASQVAGTGFSVVINSTDANGNTANVTSNTTITLTKASGSTGAFSGTLVGTLANGTNTVTISGVIYNKAISGVSCTATASGGMTLSAATSNTFTLTAGVATQLQITTIPNQTAYTGFNVTVTAADANGNASNVSSDNLITLTQATGTAGSLGGTLTGTISNGTSSVTINGVTYSTVETTPSITATSSGTPVLTTATSNIFAVGAATPIKLGITAIGTQVKGAPFSITVSSLDLGNNPQVVTGDNLITLTLATGTGTLGGTLTGTLLNGTSSVTFTGITYSKAESGVSVTATQTGTPTLTAATSATFTVSPTTYYTATSGTMNWTDASWGTSASGPFNVNLTLNGSDNVVIQNGATVNLNTNYTSITGTTITISGILNITNSYKLTAGAALTVSTTGSLNIANSLSAMADSTATNNGVLILASGSAFTLNGSMDVSGFFKDSSSSAITYGGSQTLTFENYSVCELNNAAISTAPTATWGSNSNLLITAIAATNNLLAINTHYGNFNFNYAGASTGHILTSAASGTLYIDGNFTLTNSNGTSGKCKLINGASGDNITVHIGGDFTIPANTAGQLQGSNNSSYTALNIQIGGNLSAGTGWIGSGSAITTLDLQGTGKTINTVYTFGGFTSIKVSGSYTLAAAFTPNNTSATAFSVTGTLNCAGFTLTGKSGAIFTLAAGATLETTQATGVNGAILTYTTTYTAGANYIFDGSAAQVVGAAVTTAINNLTINNSAGVSLSAATSVTGILTLTSGKLTSTSSNLLTLGTAASVSGASATSYVSGPVSWSLPLVSSATKYSFPVGTSSAYLPLDLTVTSSATGSSAKVQATSGSTGTVDATLSSISNTEYWTLTTTGTVLTDVQASLGKASLGSYFAIGKATTSATGIYTYIGGNTGMSVGGINGIGLSNAVTSTPGTAGTFYLALAVPASPVLTAAVGATVDNAFTLTYPTNDAWKSNITGVTINGTTLTTGFDASTSGQITFTPSVSSPANLLQVSGTKTFAVIATGYTNATVSQAIGAGADYQLGIKTQPVDPTINGGTLSTQPVVAVQDQYGNTTASTASVVASVGGGSWTLGGTTSKSAVSGTSTFTDLTATSASAISDAAITFSSTGLINATSVNFSIPAIASALSAGTIADFGNVTVYQTVQNSVVLTGTYLDGSDITVTAPAGFQVSTTSGSGYSSSLTISGYGTSVSQTIYVLFQPTAVQSYNANLTYAGGSVSSQNLALTGSGIALTAPSGLSFTHVADNIQRLSWTAPSGVYDKVLIFAQAASGTYTPSGAGSSYTGANADINLATTFGSTYSLVYSGTGTNVEVTGLSNNTHYYYQVVSYSGSAYSTTLTLNGTTAVQPVTALSATSANTQSVLAWTNPAYYTTQSNYWDEVMVIASAGTITTPTGDGSSYTANTVYGTVGASDGNGGYVVYKGTGTGVTVTALTNFITYNFGVFVRHGSDWSIVTSATATPNTYAVGDYGSVASSAWATTTTWKLWDGSGWNTTAATAPTATNNVWIVGGKTVTVAASGVCNNLHVINGVLKSGTVCHTVETITVSGTIIDVESGGTIGNGLTGDAADGISISTNNAGTTTISGTGGTIDVSKLIIGTAATLVVAHDITVHYHGSSDAGNAFGLYPGVSGATLTVNAGTTLTMAEWSSLSASSGSHSTPSVNFTVNINGTLTFLQGIPPGNSATNGWLNSGSAVPSNYLSMNAASTYTFAFNVGSTGTVNATEVFPNGTQSGGTAGTGSTSTISVASGGVFNIKTVADFRNASQTITGSGTVNILSGCLFEIGNTTGIAASSASGPIQTTTRNYNTGATYSYRGTTAQHTGDGLPASVAGLTVNNSTGLTLNGSVSVVDTLSLTSGIITTTSSNLITLGTGIKVIGAGSANYINGPIQHTIAGTSATAKTFPIGKGGFYSPVVLNITQNSATSTTYSAEAFVGGTTPTHTMPGTLTAISSNRYYTLSSSSSNISTAAITLVYDANDATGGGIAITTLGNIRIAGSSGWTDLGPVAGGSGGTITSTTNFTTLGDFVLANANAFASSPTLTAAVTPTVDNSFDITFNDDAIWRGLITSITYGSKTLVSGTDYSISAGVLTLIPAGSSNSGLRTSGTQTITIHASGYYDATVSQPIGAGAAAKLVMKTQPVAPAADGAALATQPVVYIQDQYGNATTSTAGVIASVGAGVWTLGGTLTVNAVAGTATFAGLTATDVTAVTGATITFTSGILTSVTSNTFNIPGLAAYYWVGGTASTNGFADRSNWSTVGVGGAVVGTSGTNIAFGASDILIFDGSDVSAASGTQTGTIAVPSFAASYSFGQLIFQNNAIVTWTASSTRTITINGGTGVDLSIPSGSSLDIGTGTSSAFTVSLLSGATASISGTLIIGDAGSSNHSISGADAASITVNSGAVVSYNGSSSQTPFGTGTTGSVIFTSGSTLKGTKGGDIFGGKAVVTFQSGSTYEYDGASNTYVPMTYGSAAQTYSNFVFNNTSSLSGIGLSANITVNNLILKSTATAAVVINLSTFTLNIKGNLGNENTTNLFTISNSTSGTGTINMNGTASQSIYAATGGITIGATSSGKLTLLNISNTSNDVVLGNGTYGGNISVATYGTVTVNNSLNVGTGTGTNGGIISGAGTFTLVSAATLKTANTSGVLGSVTTTTKSFSSLANYLFNGSSAQVTGSFVTTPTANTVSNFTINNTAGVTLSASVNVSNTLSLTSGTFTLGNNTLTISNTVNKNTTTYLGNITAAGTSTVVYVGPASIVSGLFNSNTVNNLTINRAGGVSLLSDFVVTGALSLTTGNLIIGAHTLTTGSSSGSGSLAGSSNSNLIMTGSSASTLNFNAATADSLLNTFTLNGSGQVNLGTGLGITHLLTLSNAAAKLNLNTNHLTLKSTSITNTAEVGVVATGASVTGNVTVERYIPPGIRQFRDLCPSVYGAGSVFSNWQEGGIYSTSDIYGMYITGKVGSFNAPTSVFDATTGFDYTSTGNPSLYTYIGGNWANVASTKGVYLDPFQGMRALVRGARNYNLNAQYPNMVSATTLRATGQLVIGTVNFTTTGTSSTSGASSTYGLTSGADAWSLIANPYACPIDWASIWTNNSSHNITSSYSYLDPTFLSGGYSIYVTYNGVSGVTSNSPGGSTREYIQSGQGFFIQNDGSGSTPSLVINESDKAPASTHTSVFGNTKSNMLAITLLKNLNGVPANIDGTVAVFNTNYTKNIGTEDSKKLMNPAENLYITESANELSIDGLPTPLVTDVVSLKLANVTAGETYQLNIDASQYTGLDAYVHDAYLNIDVPVTIPVIFTPTKDSGTYASRFSIVFKENVVAVNNSTKISVYPNPVAEKVFTIQTLNVAAGRYNVSMINAMGQTVMTTTINHAAGVSNETIRMDKVLSSGMYTVVMKSADGKLYQSELLAQ